MSERATYKIGKVHVETMRPKIKVGAQHRDTYRVTEGQDEEAGARGVVGYSAGTG